MLIFDVLFVLIITIVLFILFAYGKIIDFLVKGKKPDKVYKKPKITVIIPAYNEENFIKRKLNNVLKCYPKNKMEILVIDNGSTDKTVEIVKKLPVKLLKSEPGKISALNKGLKTAKTEIVIMTDADAMLDTNCIIEAIAYLHGDVAAVGGTMVLRGKNLFYMKSKNNYSKRDWGLRYKEGLLENTASLDGKFVAFRKSLFKKFPKNCYSDDFEMTLSLREKGYRSVISKESIVYEEVPSSFKEEIKQIRNRAGLIAIINFKKLRFLFNSRYGYFGSFIFPFRWFFPLLFPFFAIYILVYILSFSLLSGGLFLLAIFFLLIVFKKEFQLMQLIGGSLAWLDVISFRVRSDGKWKKVKS